MHLGNVRGERRLYDLALDWFARASRWDSSFARPYLERGVIFWRELDHPRRAIIELSKALTLNPGLHTARFNRAIAYQQLGEYARARKEFQSYLERGEHPHWREYASKMIEEFRDQERA